MPPITWTTTLGTIVLVIGIILRLLALGVIPGNRKPSTGMAWLLLIMFEPFSGFALFLLLGRTRLGRIRHKRQREAHAAIAEARASSVEFEPGSVEVRDKVATVVHLNRSLASFPVQPDNAVTLLPDYRECILAIASEIAAAKDTVDVQFYITAWDEMTDPVFQAMSDAADRGVAVRLLFDHIGSRGIPGYKQMLKKLDQTKIQWKLMLPIKPMQGRWRRPDLRNHRKLVIIDNLVGFSGSLNLTEPGYNKPKNHALGREWVELMARLEGPIAADLNAVFAADWYTETGELPNLMPFTREVTENPQTSDAPVTGLKCQLVPSGPGFPSENNLRMFNSLIYSATRRLSITSPYFVPDESLLSAVTTAAQRGVDVELFVSEIADQFMVGHAQASYYRALLEAGVKIYQYPAPYILHSKHFTVDDDIAVLGSSNMDQRSFALNYETSLMLLGPEIVTKMREVEDNYRSMSPELTLESWLKRPARLKYVDNIMRLTSAIQ
ncbi:MAG TPA: cardiolipin synthase [Marmoricola sp.]|nr:cardiolipin synthase [Marmoricola sp.]